MPLFKGKIVWRDWNLKMGKISNGIYKQSRLATDGEETGPELRVITKHFCF